MNKRYIDFVPAKKGGANTGAREKASKEASVPVDDVVQVKSGAHKVVEPIEEVVEEDDELSLEDIFVERREEIGKDVDIEDAIESVNELSLEDTAKTKKQSDKAPKYGVIEDLKPRFVKTEVPKRPLNKKPKGAAKIVDVARVEAKSDITPVEKKGLRRKKIKPQKVAKKAEPVPEPEPVKVEELPALEAVREKKVMPRGSYAVHKKPQVAGGPSAVAFGDVDRILDDALHEAENVTRRDRRFMRGTPFVNTEGVEKRPLSGSVSTKKISTPDEEPSGPVTIIQKPEKDSRMGLVVAIIITIILGATAGTVAFLLIPK